MPKKGRQKRTKRQLKGRGNGRKIKAKKRERVLTEKYVYGMVEMTGIVDKVFGENEKRRLMLT